MDEGECKTKQTNKQKIHLNSENAKKKTTNTFK